MLGRTRTCSRFSCAARGSLNASAGALTLARMSACVVRSASEAERKLRMSYASIVTAITSSVENVVARTATTNFRETERRMAAIIVRTPA